MLTEVRGKTIIRLFKYAAYAKSKKIKVVVFILYKRENKTAKRN